MRSSPRTARVITIAFVAAMVAALIVPANAWGATSKVEPAWSAEGTMWEVPPADIPAEEVDRFNALWTARFLDSEGLQAYLDRPGLYDDGFNGLSEDAKAFLIVNLIVHWQETLPEFGRDLWTGVAAEDQKSFEQLAIMMYAVVFAKDEFIASLKAPEMPAGPLPPAPEDAGIPEFPGMSQKEISAYFDGIHAIQTIVTPEPAAPDLGVAPHLVPGQETLVEAPARPLAKLVEAATEVVPLQAAPAMETRTIRLQPVERQRANAVLPSPIDGEPSVPETPTIESLLALVPVDVTDVNVAPPDPNMLLNTIAGGTYMACGSLGAGAIHCAAVPSPLGVPVALDVDGDVLTGVAGAEVTVLLGPTVNPDFALGGFAAELRVDRTMPSAIPLSTPLPAQVFVVYTVPGAATQILAGFDGRADTLGDTQSVRVTIKDVALALAGDVQIRSELTRAGPGNTLTLLAGFAQIDPLVFPPAPTDPTTVGLRFDPVPDSLVADLRFADVLGQSVIEGSVDASLSPTVTATIGMERGDERRTLVGIIESMPTALDFRVVSEAVGAVGLDYSANAPFPRFELHDVLVPDVNDPATFSTLDAVVLGIPASIHFDIGRPFDIHYLASDRVTQATIVITQNDANGLVSAMGASVAGVPSEWSIDGTQSPLQVDYLANGNIDAVDAFMMERDSEMVASGHVEDIPDALTILVGAERLQIIASQPIGLIEGSYSTGGLAPFGAAGEFASFRADGSGAIAAAARVAGFTSLDIDQRTTDRMIADVAIAGGEPFTAIVGTPEAFIVGQLSNLPTNIHLDLTPSSFTYDLAQPITQITLHAELADLAADVIVNDLPDQLSVGWTSTSLTYDANAPISRVRAWLDKGNLAAFADITGIPADFSVAWPSGTATFSTPTAVGSILVQASVNGGGILTMAGDHATLTKAGSALGVELRLSGLKSLNVNPANGGSYGLALSPGGQAFSVFANIDGLIAQAFVSNLPSTIQVDLPYGTTGGAFSYDAPTTVSRVWASADAASGPLYAYVDLQGLPSRVDLTWTSGTAPTVVYDSSSSLTSAYAFVRTSSNAVYEATITSLAPYLRIVGAPNDIIVDARTSAAGASASGVIGSITARYGSDGLVLGGSGNYAAFYQTASITRASIGYSGLKYIRMSQAGDNLLVDVQNSAPRYFTAWADTPEAYVSLTIDSIPAHVSVTGSGTTFTYNAYGATISEIAAYFSDKESLDVSASVRGIPGTATINVNMPASAITYSASSAITAIDVDAWINEWYGRLRIGSVPTAWTASFGGGTFGFDAYPNSIGSVEAAVTNHGSWTTFAGNHLNLDFVNGGNVDASLKMTAVQRALYSRTANNQNIDFRMGGGTNFVAVLEALLSNGERAYAYASFAPLPSSIQASIGEKLTVNTNQNFDTYIYGEYGLPAAITATPAPPYVHGISVRDGVSGSAKALKGQLYLTGLPTSVSFDARNTTFGFTNWRPTTSTLIADAELDNFVSPAIDLYVSQSGIPNPQSLTFNMDSLDIGSGNKRVQVDVTQTAGMGALFADLVYGGTQHGRLTVSNIPDDIHMTYTVQNGQSSIVWDATAAISNIFAAFRVMSSGTFQGYVSLSQLPSDFSLTFGRASGGQGPTMTYNANADTLDVSAFVDATLFGGDLKARLSFGLTNLGRDLDIFVSGTGVRFTSTPATSQVFAAVWATYNYYTADSGTWDAGGFVEYPWAYHVGVNPTINNFQVTLNNFSDFSLAWGVTSKISGSYSSFSFGWDSFTVNLHAYGKIQIVVDWPWPFGSSTINIVNIHYHPPTFTLDVLFHKYTNHQAYWFGTSGSIICDWSIWMDIRPHPHGASWNGVSTSPASEGGGAWYITPNPWGALPGWGIDLAARYTSPDGGGIGGPHFDYNC